MRSLFPCSYRSALLIVLTMLMLASQANAQLFKKNRAQPVNPFGPSCPNGVCPNAQPQFAPPFIPLAQPMPENVPAPKFTAVGDYQDLHDGLVYRHFQDRWALALIREKGMEPDKAHKLARSLSHESYDEYAKAVGIKTGVKESTGLGGGKVIQWILDHQDQIAALVKLLMTIFAFADAGQLERFEACNGQSMPETIAALLELLALVA